MRESRCHHRQACQIRVLILFNYLRAATPSPLRCQRNGSVPTSTPAQIRCEGGLQDGSSSWSALSCGSLPDHCQTIGHRAESCLAGGTQSSHGIWWPAQQPEPGQKECSVQEFRSDYATHINQLSCNPRATISRARKCTCPYHEIIESAPDFAHSTTTDTPDKVLVVAGAEPRNETFLYREWAQ